MTLLLGILILVLGALIGAGTVAICVAAADGDKHADVARFLEGLDFSSMNQGRDVLMNRHDFNRMARMAAANQLRYSNGPMAIRIESTTKGAGPGRPGTRQVASHADDWPPNTAVPCTICSQQVTKPAWLDHYFDAHNVAQNLTPRFDVIADWYYALRPLDHPIHGSSTDQRAVQT